MSRPLRIVCVGAGPAGLYFALLMKKANPAHQVTVLERNRLEDTFGFGVVFSDATMGNLTDADPESCAAIREAFFHWDDINIHYRGQVLASTGHGFAGLSRVRLLTILAERALELGVELKFEIEIDRLDGSLDDSDDNVGGELLRAADLIVGADGANSTVRDRLADTFEPSIDWRPDRFVWLGTSCPFPAFTFDFRDDEHGLWRLHAYQYDGEFSTFIVETTEKALRAAGLTDDDEAATIEYCERLFAERLGGHRLVANRSIWRRFPTIKNTRWSCGNVVLMGDAAHTAHYSIGSGTKLAMEDAISLAEHLRDIELPAPPAARATPPELTAALEAYTRERIPLVESLQRAAQASLQWFESTHRYMGTEPIQFGFNLLTRSLRITHEDLRLRDPEYVDRIDHSFAESAAAQSGVPVGDMAALPWRLSPRITRPEPERRDSEPDSRKRSQAASSSEGGRAAIPPPMFTPFRLRDMLLANRVVVSAMCQYLANDGTPDDWHFVHLGSRAVGGAGLVMTEMTDISPTARITPGCAGMYAAEHVNAWKRIVDFAHSNSYAKVGLQLAHAGRKGSTRLVWEGIDEPLERGGWPLLAASAIPWFERSPVPKAMERSDMDGVRDDFVRAAEMADAAGFDLIELHFAHGYLLSSFISPLTNQRDDEYGGSVENRMRFPLEILDSVRSSWPTGKPISVRISAVDWAPDGLRPEDAVEIGRMLKEHACDIVDVSAGQTVPHAKPVYGRQFQTPFADRIRHEAGIATMAVGNISSHMDVNTILASGRADLCALARAHLWDPYWIHNAAQKLGYSLPWPDPYSVLDNYTPRFE